MQNSPRSISKSQFKVNLQTLNIDLNDWNATLYVFENDVFASYKTVARGVGLGKSYNKVKNIVDDNNENNTSVLRVYHNDDEQNSDGNFTSLLSSGGILNVAETINTTEALEFANLILNIVSNIKNERVQNLHVAANNANENSENNDNSNSITERVANALTTSERTVLIEKIIDKMDRLDPNVQLELVKTILK